MPRDGSGIYTQPFPIVVDGTTIESAVYNGFTTDVATDLNTPRPIMAGGTGASSADQALFNLAAEKAAQVVTNYDSHVFLPGSFRSAAGATGAPNAHAFAGTVTIGEALANPPTNQNVVVEARDLGDTVSPGRKYVREKKAGTWGSWGEGVYAAPFDALAYSGMQINGSMEVSQELGGAGRATIGYICDGWKTYFAGSMAISAAVSISSSGISGIPSIFYVIVTTAQPSLGANDQVVVYQDIEGYRISRLAWGATNAQPITIGFWSHHQRTGIYSVSANNGTRSYVTTYTHNVSDVPQYNVVTIPGDTSGAWATNNTSGIQIKFCMAAGATPTAPSANTWFGINYSAAPGQVNAAQATSDRFRITGVVVLPGIEAPSAARSPLIMRPYDQELLTCQRYYERVVGGYRMQSPASGLIAVNLKCVPKRATPTVGTLVNGGINNSSAAATIAYDVAGVVIQFTHPANTDSYNMQFSCPVEARL
jgi:hypothetical protein